ncbi:hypothetical protein PoB_001450100 [Plakobranchus ocellatus]|uniref:Uncharacterized protein n=1 Tax=Plakobranchus ocellatus TaxID=259542 RepID=A0AAV3YL29_9GAST|nr:hypothetical protein PoB_001450100 [Plakobranchus ocellatus]
MSHHSALVNVWVDGIALCLTFRDLSRSVFGSERAVTVGFEPVNARTLHTEGRWCHLDKDKDLFGHEFGPTTDASAYRRWV